MRNIDNELEYDLRKLANSHIFSLACLSNDVNLLGKELSESVSEDGRQNLLQSISEKQDQIERIIEFSSLDIKNKKLSLLIEKISDIVICKRQSYRYAVDYFEKMKELIRDGANPNLESFGDMTPLFLSALVGNVDMISFLKVFGADIYKKHRTEGQTLLHFAFSSSNKISALAVFNIFADVSSEDIMNCENIYKITPLAQTLVASTNFGTISDLMITNPNVNNSSIENFCKIYDKIRPGDSVIKDYLCDKGIDIRKYVNNILRVKENGLVGINVFKLLKLFEIERKEENLSNEESGIVTNSINNTISRITDLCNLCEKENIGKNLLYILDSIRKIELEKVGRELLHKNNYRYEQSVLIKIAGNLIKRGFDSNVSDNKLNSSILNLAIESNPNAARKLLNLGTGYPLADYDGKYPLHVASASNAVDVIRDIVAKPDFNIEHLNLKNENDGNTALHYAVINNCKDAAILLSDLGCSKDILNKDKKNVRQLATKEMHDILFSKEVFEDERNKAIEEFPQLMRLIYGAVKNKANFENSLKKILFFINKFDFDTNVKTEQDWNILHFAAKGGHKEEVNSLIRKGLNLNALTKEGFSVVRLAVDSKNSEVVESILSCENLDFSLIKDAIKHTIQSGNKNNVLSSFANSTVVINKFAENFSKKECEKFFTECNQIINTGVCGSKKHAIDTKSCIKSLIDAINDVASSKQEEEKDEKISEATRLSKNERKKLAKERKSEKQELEEKIKKERQIIREEQSKIREQKRTEEELEKIRIEKIIADIADENKKMSDEDSQAFRLREYDKILSETARMTEEDVRSGRYKAEKKMLDAKEFIPLAQLELERKQKELKNQQDEMEVFLAKKGQGINSIIDIPPFVAEIIRNLQGEGYRVLLRGSSVNENCQGDRVPVDLDIEVIGKGFMKKDLDGSMAKDLFKKFFDLEISENDIYRGNGDDYTISVKDKLRKIDISFYDSESKSRYTWLDSKEKKRIIENDGSLREVKPIGFDKYLRSHHKLEREVNGVMFNHDAKKLILITALRKTLGILSEDEIYPQGKASEYGLLKAISPADPIDLLVKELRIGGSFFPRDEDKNIFVKDKINSFMESHALNCEYQLEFLSNLSEMISKTNGVRMMANANHVVVANAIDEMKFTLQSPKTKLEAKAVLKVCNNSKELV